MGVPPWRFTGIGLLFPSYIVKWRPVIVKRPQGTTVTILLGNGSLNVIQFNYKFSPYRYMGGGVGMDLIKLTQTVIESRETGPGL